MEFKDYYKILEISKDSTKPEIIVAFKNLAKKWHPDKNIGIDTTEKMQDLNEAYLILKDDEARLKYDVEYEKFYNRFRETPVKSEDFQGYEFDDEVLKRWVNNARNQAKRIVGEIGELTVGATKEIGNKFMQLIVYSIIMGIVAIILMQTCSN